MSDCTTDLIELGLENLFSQPIDVSPPVACPVKLWQSPDSVNHALMLLLIWAELCVCVCTDPGQRVRTLLYRVLHHVLCSAVIIHGAVAYLTWVAQTHCWCCKAVMCNTQGLCVSLTPFVRVRKQWKSNRDTGKYHHFSAEILAENRRLILYLLHLLLPGLVALDGWTQVFTANLPDFLSFTCMYSDLLLLSFILLFSLFIQHTAPVHTAR